MSPLTDQVAPVRPPAVLARGDIFLGPGGQPAVDNQDVPADEAGVVAGQPQGGVRDVVGHANPAA